MFAVKNTDNATHIRFSIPMMCISSAVHCGGIRTISAIINYTLRKDEWLELRQMPLFCEKILLNERCNPSTGAVLLTTVPQRYGGRSSDGNCFVTAGLGNAISLEPEKIWDERKGEHVYIPGTINCIHVVTEPLSDEALIEAYGIARLTIGMCVSKWSEKYRPGEECVGTPTDCVAVACPIAPSPLCFAGLGTKIGSVIAKNTKEAMQKALFHKYADILLYAKV